MVVAYQNIDFIFCFTLWNVHIRWIWISYMYYSWSLTFVWCWFRMYWMESIIPAHLHLFNNDMWQVDLLNDDGSSGKCTLLLTGYLRARNLSVNQLVGYSIWHLFGGNQKVITMSALIFSGSGSSFRCGWFSVSQNWRSQWSMPFKFEKTRRLHGFRWSAWCTGMDSLKKAK